MKKLQLTITLFAIFFTIHGQDLFDIHEKNCQHQTRFQNSQFFQVLSNPLLSKYDVKFYKLDINAERNTTAVSGNVTILSKAVSSVLDTFAFELKNNMFIDSVKLNGIIQPTVLRTGDDVNVPLTMAITGGNLFSMQIFYHGTPIPSGFFSGINTATSSTYGNQVTWTLSEPFNALEWWPCKQDLKDKADSVHVFITTSSENKVGSNGLLTAVVSLPNNKKRYEWKSKYPIDYYLISFSVAKYVDYSIYAHPAGLQDSILIQNYIYDNPLCLTINKNNIDMTVNLLELFSSLLSIYPFKDEKYGHCLAELGGGMEHQTMTTIGSFSFGLVAHELGHMWFGDNVTCATWSDIWINEGFASYTEYLAAQYLQSQSNANSWMNSAHSYIMSQPGGSVYIPPQYATDENRIFDGRLSYKKGAAIIHMLRFETANDSLFFAGLRNFQALYKDSVATGLDFKTVMENTTSKNFTDFFNQWYFGEGFPTFNLLYQQYNDTLFLSVTQTTSTTITSLFKTDMEYRLNYNGGDTIIRLHQNANITNYEIPFNKTISSIDVDPNNWILNQVGSIIVGQRDASSQILLSAGPNPFHDRIYIRLQSVNEMTTMKIYDIHGNRIKQQNITECSFDIDLGSLPRGMYLLEINNGKEMITQKLLKQ